MALTVTDVDIPWPADFDCVKFDARLRLSGLTAGSVEDVLVNIEVAERPEPVFDAGNFVTVTFRPNPEVRQAAGGELGRTQQVTPEVTPQVAPQVTPQVTGEVAPQVRLLQAISGEMTARQLREVLNLADREHFRSAYLLPALDAGRVEMTIPEKPRSRLQRYRLTDAGLAHLQRTPTRTTGDAA